MDNNGYTGGDNSGCNVNNNGADNYGSNAYSEGSYHYKASDLGSNGVNSDSQNNDYSSQNGSSQGSYSWNFPDYQNDSRTPKKKKKNTGVVAFCSVLACVLLVGVIALSGYGVYALYDNAKDKNEETVKSDNLSVSEAAIELKDKPKELSGVPVYTDSGLSTVEIAKKVSPSVVGITMYADSRSFDATGTGSGIIFSSDGYIVTNAHVVNGAIALNVELNNGDTYAAKIIGIDVKSDLAVIKIDGENLPVADFGNSDELEVGEQIVAIGNPGGNTLFGSVTQGIVSGLNRTIKDGGSSVSYIQVDAAINPGNSGGALVNSFGQVVGINSAKIAGVDYEGIGFSIPIKEAEPIINDLRNFGYVTGRTKIGITGKIIPEVIGNIYGYPTGIQIHTIDVNSDLANSKAVQGDIITHINDQRVEDFDDISAALEGKKAGEKVKLSLFRPERGGVGKTFDVVCELMADVDKAAVEMQQKN